ncbi:hypothetical protein B0A52_03678 [Exophiala mesophila]|uniref:Uncharacterized protein n=1 Tax=Exophiala mesophila TaxID=212818 RepID=A0A438N9N7_EXOME|nr:hypothetical protein B0A52_03678 [Exophiala mesophila]
MLYRAVGFESTKLPKSDLNSKDEWETLEAALLTLLGKPSVPEEMSAADSNRPGRKPMEMARSPTDVDVVEAGAHMLVASYPEELHLDNDTDSDAIGPYRVGAEASNEPVPASEDTTTTVPDGVRAEVSNEHDQASEDATNTGPNGVGGEASNEFDQGFDNTKTIKHG